MFAKYEHAPLGKTVKVAKIGQDTAYRITKEQAYCGSRATAYTIVFVRHMGPDYSGRVVSLDSYNRRFMSKDKAIEWAQEVGRFLR